MIVKDLEFATREILKLTFIKRMKKIYVPIGVRKYYSRQTRRDQIRRFSRRTSLWKPKELKKAFDHEEWKKCFQVKQEEPDIVNAKKKSRLNVDNINGLGLRHDLDYVLEPVDCYRVETLHKGHSIVYNRRIIE